MSSIHLVGGEKGGVGKSVVARLLCQWLQDHSVPFCGLDADLSQGALLRSYADRCHAVDLSEFESADQILDRALGAERAVVVDLAARSLTLLTRWVQSADVVSLAAELNVQLVYFHVTDGGFESLRSLETAIEVLGPATRIVLVCNLGRSREFSHLVASSSVRALLDRGGVVIELPSLDPQIMSKVEGRPVSLHSALFAGQGEAALSQMQKRRASAWLSRAYAQLQPVLGQFSPTGLSGIQTEIVAQRGAALSSTATAAIAVPRAAIPTEATASEATASASEASESEASASKATNADSVDSDEFPPLGPKVILPPAGTVILDGARTWTEVGEDYQIHHVRYR